MSTFLFLLLLLIFCFAYIFNVFQFIRFIEFSLSFLFFPHFFLSLSFFFLIFSYFFIFSYFLFLFFSSSTDEIDIEIFDLLMSLGDFAQFKALMLSHKKSKQSEKSGGTELLSVFGVHMTANSTSKMNVEKSN